MHWAEQYVGKPYSECDCAQLSVLVQREQFGREVDLPSERATGLRGLSAQIDSGKSDVAERIGQPREGCAVLMIGAGRLNHIGTYCEIGGVGYVLHAVRNVGHTCLHRLRELPALNLKVEGFYSWK